MLMIFTYIFKDITTIYLNMSFLRFQKYRELYVTMLPLMTAYPTLVGIDAGFTFVNKLNPAENSIDRYSTILGYTGIGIITGLTYPVSYPLFACYVLYKNRT
jgi:hypothetical protein